MIGTTSIFVAVGLGIALIARPHDKRLIHAFLVSLATVPILVISALVFRTFSSASQVRYDEFFYQIDRYFGSPSYAVGRILMMHHWALPVVVFDYQLFIDAAVVCIVLTFLSSGVLDGYRAFGTMLTTAILLPLAYKLFPASGPIFAFEGFPFSRPTIVTPHAILLAAPPNCFPSGHLAMALLCLFFMRRRPILRWVAAIHVTLTLIATLGLGEHYVIDLMASVPYVFAVLWAWRWLSIPYHAERFIITSPELPVVGH